MNAGVPLRIEWAVEGKLPGSSDEYGLLACSRGPLTRRSFGEISGRYVTGTPSQLPQVTIGWVGGGDQTRLLLIIRRWSGQSDWTGRPIASTHYFSVTHEQLGECRVSYEALYDVLDRQPPLIDLGDPADGEPFEVTVPVLDHVDLGRRVNRTALDAAALLMAADDMQVCVVGAESLPPRERLRFLDVTASLLPYGMRAKLSASTWTTGAANHKIMLSFASNVPARASRLSMGEAAALPYEAHSYHGLLMRQQGRFPELVAWLAADPELRTFAAEDRARALEWLAGLENPSAHGRHEAAETIAYSKRGTIESALRDCGDYIGKREYARLSEPKEFLEDALDTRTGRFDPAGQPGYRAIVQELRLLAGPQGLAEDQWDPIRDVILRIAYGPELALDGLLHIKGQFEHLPTGLMKSMLNMGHSDAYVSLYLAGRLSDHRLPKEMANLTSGSLVRAAAQEPYDVYVVDAVYHELVRRGASDPDGPMVRALQEHGHLAKPFAHVHRDEPSIAHRRLGRLLLAGYGPAFGIAEFTEIVRFPLKPGEGPLLAAALDLAGPDSGEAVCAAVIKYLLEEGLAKTDVDRLGAAMLTPNPLSEILPIGQGSPPGRRAGPRGQEGPIHTSGKTPGGRHSRGQPFDHDVHESRARRWGRALRRSMPRELSFWALLAWFVLVLVAGVIVVFIIRGFMTSVGTGTQPPGTPASQPVYSPPMSSAPTAPPDGTMTPEEPSEQGDPRAPGESASR